MYEEDQTVETVAQDVDGLWEAVDTAPEEVDQLPEEPAAGIDPAAEETDQRPQGETPPDQEGRPDDQPPETFTLKHLDEVRQVGKEEVVTLAQKGLDYDRIRTERDELRQHRQEADPALALVRGYAERNGMTVEQYIDYCRKQELLGQGINEPTAQAQVELERRQAQLEAQTRAGQEARQRQEAIVRQTQERQEARKKDMTAFLEAFPGVKGADVPREVWARVAAGESLVTAYAMHQNQQLQAQLAALKQNKENAARTPGSLNTQGEKAGASLADLWDAAGE